MKVFAVLNNDEAYAVEAICSVLQTDECSVECLVIEPQFGATCGQSSAISQSISGADVLVYIGSKGAQDNSCISYALQEAARLGKKIICVRLDSSAELDPIFKGLGDGLIYDFSNLPQAIFERAYEWVGENGVELDETKLERFKCGNKK